MATRRQKRNLEKKKRKEKKEPKISTYKKNYDELIILCSKTLKTIQLVNTVLAVTELTKLYPDEMSEARTLNDELRDTLGTFEDTGVNLDITGKRKFNINLLTEYAIIAETLHTMDRLVYELSLTEAYIIGMEILRLSEEGDKNGK